MKTPRWQSLLLTGAALATIPAALIYTDYAISNLPEAEREPPQQARALVSVQSVSSASHHSQLSLYGEVQAREQIQLNSQLDGPVTWRNPAFVVGGQIAKGDTLIRLDETRYKVALANAREQLASAELTLEQERRQQRQAKRDWQRSGIGEKPSALALRQPQLSLAKASIAAAKAALAQAKRDLKNTHIKAPFDALIISRDTGIGSVVAAGDLIATLRRSSQAQINLSLSAQQWQQLPSDPAGLAVDIHSESLPGQQWQGVIARLEPVVDSQTRLRQLVVYIDQPLAGPAPLLFGSFVTATLQGQAVDQLFAIPESALGPDGSLWYVEQQQLKRVFRSPTFSHSGQLYVPRQQLPNPLQLVSHPLASYLPGMPVSTSEEP